MASYKDNKWLIVNDDVKMTPIIEPVIFSLDKEFEAFGVKAFVTSGLRTSADQLATILKYCKRYNIDDEFPEILTCKFTDKLQNEPTIYAWQKPWSRLLDIGVIINPPLPAVCLFNYMRDGVNKKGQKIGHSPHYFGSSFDIGGGLDHDITNELKVIEAVVKSKKTPNLVGFLSERKNNCVHCDCRH